MSTIQFYDVKARAKVDVPVSDVKRKKYVRETKNGSTQVRYAVRANYNGTNLTKFVSEATYNELSDCPEEA